MLFPFYLLKNIFSSDFFFQERTSTLHLVEFQVSASVSKVCPAGEQDGVSPCVWELHPSWSETTTTVGRGRDRRREGQREGQREGRERRRRKRLLRAEQEKEEEGQVRGEWEHTTRWREQGKQPDSKEKCSKLMSGRFGKEDRNRLQGVRKYLVTINQ